MKETVGARRNSFVAVYTSGTDDTDRRFLLFHYSCLNGRGVGAQKHVRLPLDEERVLHVAGWMVGSKVKSREHMPVILYFRTLGDRESKTAEYRDDLFPDD